MYKHSERRAVLLEDDFKYLVNTLNATTLVVSAFGGMEHSRLLDGIARADKNHTPNERELQSCAICP